MNGIIARFPRKTWVQDWPHKVNLDDHPTIVQKLREMAKAEVSTHYQPRQYQDKLFEWRYGYIDRLGNDAFLEIGPDSHEGLVLFHTDEEAVQFILTHS